VRRSSLQQRHKLKTNTFLLLLTVLAAAVMCLNLVSLTAVDTGAHDLMRSYKLLSRNKKSCVVLCVHAL
jgi:hypothetical protein